MAMLLLPTEILGRIIRETMPENFENFALTCRTMYNASAFLRQKHNALKSRYRDFEYDLATDEDTCTSSLQLITRIAEEPLIARYIVSANLKQDSPPEDHEIAAAHIRDVKAESRVLSLLENSPYVQSAGVDPESVLDQMINSYTPDDSDPGLMAAFLLTLLPNVTELSLPNTWEVFGSGEAGTWKMSDVLDSIIIRANDDSDPTAGLSKLNTLFPSTGWGYENRWTLSTFEPFLSIKSLRSFCAGSCRALDDGYTGAKFEDPKHDSFGAGLEVVELVGAVVNDTELRKFLSRLPRLRSFKLSYETKWHGCGHDYNAGAAMEAIEDSVGEYLEDLSFTILNCYGDVERVASMKKFKKLREVELDVEVLLGPEAEDGDISRLGDLLPPTVERFCLVVKELKNSTRILNMLFSEIAATKHEKLPNLTTIVIRNDSKGLLEENSEDLDEVDLDDQDAENYQDAEDDQEAEDVSNNASNADPDGGLESPAQTRSDPPEPRTWDADLEALGTSVAIKLVRVNERDGFGYGTVTPCFMRNFCTRYEVECI